jgi:hypothetical protein
MNWLNFDHSVEAIALSKSQTGPSGVSASRYAHRAERLDLPGTTPAAAGNPFRSSSIIIRAVLSNKRGSPLWS